MAKAKGCAMTECAGTALVTGGAKRIGAEIVRQLAQAGYRVVIHYAQAEAQAHALHDELMQKGKACDLVKADLADADAVGGLMASARQQAGPIDLLVNNASVFLPDRAKHYDAALWHNHFAVNVQAPCRLAADFYAQTDVEITQDRVIINVLDQRVLHPNPLYFSYTLSKSALWTATKTMAQSFAPHVRVNGVGPGPTLPNEQDGLTGLAYERAGVLLQKGPEPSDIAEAVLYLARARLVTGQMLAVDGGQHLGWKTPDIMPDEQA